MFHQTLLSLGERKLDFLNKRAQILTENIANSDIRGVYRKDLKSFKDILNHSPKDHLHFKKNDVVALKEDIQKSKETMNMALVTQEHDAILSMMKQYYKMGQLVANFQA
jgi:flagellar basal body rod protein FlgB